MYLLKVLIFNKFNFKICADRMKPFILKFGPRKGDLTDQNRNHLTVSFKEEFCFLN